MNRGIKAVVLAAGKGTRMQTDGCDLPKVMRLVLGRPLLGYVLSALDFIPPEDIIAVVGYKKEQIISAFGGYVFAEQTEQLGTGHAVMSALTALDGFEGDILVCCGDMPLIKKETYEALVNAHRSGGYACTMLTGTSDADLPYGRVQRDSEGNFLRVIEDRDCTPEQKKIRELNSGVYVFESSALRQALGQLSCNNAQGEYYLTDVPEFIMAKGMPVGVCCRELGLEIIGVNTPEQLREVERVLSE